MANVERLQGVVEFRWCGKLGTAISAANGYRSPDVKTGVMVARHDRYFDSKTSIPLSYLVFTKIPVVPTRYSCWFSRSLT